MCSFIQWFLQHEQISIIVLAVFLFAWLMIWTTQGFRRLKREMALVCYCDHDRDSHPHANGCTVCRCPGWTPRFRPLTSDEVIARTRR